MKSKIEKRFVKNDLTKTNKIYSTQVTFYSYASFILLIEFQLLRRY